VRTFQEIQRLLSAEGVIARRDHPELDTTLRYLLRRGELAKVLPGIYAAADRAASLQTRVRALSRFDPDAILIGAVAARLSFWPELRVEAVECAVRHSRASQTGYDFTRRHIPVELVVNRSGLRYTAPALTALDLCATVGGDAIDQALRTRATTLASPSGDGAHGCPGRQPKQAPAAARFPREPWSRGRGVHRYCAMPALPGKANRRWF
jgi:hypothetical protein